MIDALDALHLILGGLVLANVIVWYCLFKGR